MPYIKETILPLIEEQQHLFDYDDDRVHLQAGVDFLTGHTITAPVFEDVAAARQMRVFIPLLRIPDHWDDNDRLVLQLLSPALTWQECRDAFLRHVAPLMDAPGTSTSIVLRFSYFTSYMQQRGCTPEEIGTALISYSGDGNNFDLSPLKFTPLRKFLQDLIKSAEWQTIDAYLRTWKTRSWNSLFFRLLTKGHPDKQAEYLEAVLQQPEKGFVNFELSRVLLQTNIDKYELVVEQATRHLAAVPDYASQFTGYYLLSDQRPGKYNSRLLQAAYLYLREYNSSMASQAFLQQQLDSKGNTDVPPPEALAVKELLKLDRLNALPFLDQYLTERRYLHPSAFLFMLQLLQEQAAPLLMKAVDNDYDARHILPLLTQLPSALYLDQLWVFTLHKLKSVRSLVAVILADHPQALEKAGELLLHSKAEQRLTAVQILCRLNSEEARTLLQQTLHKEVNDDARDMMLETLGSGITSVEGLEAVHQLVAYAKKRGKLTRPLEPWLDNNFLPPLFLQDGTPLTQDMMRFLLYRMSRIKEMHTDVEARPLLRLLDRSSSVNFANQLYSLFSAHGGDAKLKHLLALAALTGDEALSARILDDIVEWATMKRMKVAEAGVGALALQGSNQSLRYLEFLSRRYKVKKSNIGAAAVAAMQYAAEEAGMNVDELGDRIVPDFGFHGLLWPFSVKNDTYHVYIDLHFKPGFINHRQRRLKFLPVVVSQATKDAIKRISKDVAEAVKLQSPRLENYLVTQRRWEARQWQQSFLHNPLLFVYANRLLWALYDQDDHLITCFRCQDDGSFVNQHQEKIELPEGAGIRILHPIFLDTATLQQWRQHFASRGIVPVFPQLERRVTVLQPEYADATQLHDFEEVALESSLLHRHMEVRGWRLSEGADGRYAYAYHKTDDEQQLEGVIEMSITYREESICYKLGKLYFQDAAKHLLTLGQVPAVFYSEVIADLSVSGNIPELI
ncbi:MAG TPA: DUF4132 domain-containing protein [Chitinophaga sp.]|uniref:DUF4132 domain-containing protein n=1 Tax=Chitinophaga sp. TaxID=1869181 RepID=UPI002D1A7A97|nr:DUF4132 domain-containing protein [Chitinophaga sp.]HVI44155.1 DUF4132 domain-containing protein [Chitinophaga sp.]